jgi:hypothetical protein
LRSDTSRAVAPLIVASLDQYLLFGQYDLLCDHVWRSHTAYRHPTHNIVASYKETIQSDIGPTNSHALTYFTMNFYSDEEDEERRDLLCGLSSTWSDLGIALIVSELWNSRPNVWTMEYQWRLFFPHVNALLLVEVADEEEVDPLASFRRRASIAPHGYRLLKELLSQTRKCSLYISNEESAPDNPLRICQLLLNRMMEASTNISQQTPLLPTAVHIYHELKLLLAKYRPINQVNIVDLLMQNCPYPGLKPKIVDLLRSMVEWKNACDAESKVWQFVEQHFLLPIEMQLRGWSTGESSTSAILSSLIDGTEYFAANLGLIHVWVMYRREIPGDLNHCQSRITEIHSQLQSLVAQHVSSNNSQSLSLEIYRLELLENSLQRIIDVMLELASFGDLL